MVWSLWRHQQVIVTSTAEHKRSEWDTGLMSEDRRFYRHWWICYAHVYAITQVLFWCLSIYQTYRERINGPPLECLYYSTYFQSTWKIWLILVEINSNYRLIWMLVPFSWNEKHHFFRYLVHANLYSLIPLQIHRPPMTAWLCIYWYICKQLMLEYGRQLHINVCLYIFHGKSCMMSNQIEKIAWRMYMAHVALL